MTLVVGYLLLDEQITVMSVIGAVLITVGVIVALKKPKGRALDLPYIQKPCAAQPRTVFC